MSNSLRPHESQHARPPCPSPTPGVHSDSHPTSQWCHPAISSSVIPFSSCPQSLPASESFPMSQLIWHEVAKVPEFQLQHHSFQRNPRADLLQNGLVGSPCRVILNTVWLTRPQISRLLFRIHDSAISLTLRCNYFPNVSPPHQFIQPLLLLNV